MGGSAGGGGSLRGGVGTQGGGTPWSQVPMQGMPGGMNYWQSPQMSYGFAPYSMQGYGFPPQLSNTMGYGWQIPQMPSQPANPGYAWRYGTPTPPPGQMTTQDMRWYQAPQGLTGDYKSLTDIYQALLGGLNQPAATTPATATPAATESAAPAPAIPTPPAAPPAAGAGGAVPQRDWNSLYQLITGPEGNLAGQTYKGVPVSALRTAIQSRYEGPQMSSQQLRQLGLQPQMVEQVYQNLLPMWRQEHPELYRAERPPALSNVRSSLEQLQRGETPLVSQWMGKPLQSWADQFAKIGRGESVDEDTQYWYNQLMGIPTGPQSVAEMNPIEQLIMRGFVNRVPGGGRSPLMQDFTTNYFGQPFQKLPGYQALVDQGLIKP